MKKTIKVTAAAILSAAAMNFMNITTHAEGQLMTNWTRRSQDEINAHVAEVLADGSLSYVIQPGDTLSGIAEALDIPTELLAQLNNIENPDLIIAGTTLIFNAETQTITIENPGQEPVEIQAESVAPTEVAVVEEVTEWIATPETEENTTPVVEETIEPSVETIQPVEEWVQPTESNEVVEEEPTIEESAVEESVAAESTVEEPVVEEPIAAESTVEESVVEEPVAAESTLEEPVVEELVAAESTVEEPAVEAPADDERVYKEPVYEEIVTEESVYEEPVYEAPVVEEPVYEEPVAPVETPAVNASIPAHLQELAAYPENAGLSVSELEAKYEIRRRESTHNYDVYSVSGNHYGAYQMLDAYFHQYGDGTRSASSQEAASNGYVMNRYGSWQDALAAHNVQGWY
ncbi:LysM peptidoglycan-binding domain-containing protein [Aerococcaceae bacterium DSM 111020]|nr:LysM peptidoglycan-binding domain-containing protein [Aerococcaceae bacterium DSM 111020]